MHLLMNVEDTVSLQTVYVDIPSFCTKYSTASNPPTPQGVCFAGQNFVAPEAFWQKDPWMNILKYFYVPEFWACESEGRT